MDSIAQVLEIVAVFLLLGAVGEFVFSCTGIPDVLWLVCAGVLAGPVFGLVSPTLLQPAVPLFGALALTIILSGGASRLRLEDVAAAGPRGLLLGLAGFVLSVASVWPVALARHRDGASEAGSIFSVADRRHDRWRHQFPDHHAHDGGGKIDPRMARLLEVESSSTDALSIVLTMVLVDLLLTGGVSLCG